MTINEPQGEDTTTQPPESKLQEQLEHLKKVATAAVIGVGMAASGVAVPTAEVVGNVGDAMSYLNDATMSYRIEDVAQSDPLAEVQCSEDQAEVTAEAPAEPSKDQTNLASASQAAEDEKKKQQKREQDAHNASLTAKVGTPAETPAAEPEEDYDYGYGY